MNLVQIFFLLPLSPSTHLNQIKFLLNSHNFILLGRYVVFTNRTYPKFSLASYSAKRFPQYTPNAIPKRFPRYTPNTRPKRLPRYTLNAMPEIIPWLRLKMRTPCMLSFLVLQAPTATESDPITQQLHWCFWRYECWRPHVTAEHESRNLCMIYICQFLFWINSVWKRLLCK